MIRTVPSAIAIAALSLGFAATAQAEETLKLNLNDPLNESASKGLSGAPIQSAPLTAGAPYVITVSGTGSIWARGAYGNSGTCGVAEAEPMEAAPGEQTAPASWDAATVFAAPIGAIIGPRGTACAGLQVPLGTSSDFYAGFQFTVGGPYLRPSPVGGFRSVPRTDHTYSYQVTGTGVPAKFRFSDAPSTDNSGVLTVVVRTAAECDAASCLGQTAPTTDQLGTPKVATSTVSVAVDGTRACTVEKVLSVRLQQPKGVTFAKATYYLNGKKTRVITKPSAMFQAGTKSKVIRAQKFKGLGGGAVSLRVEVRTTKGQKLSIKRTIARCNTTKKARTITFK